MQVEVSTRVSASTTGPSPERLSVRERRDTAGTSSFAAGDDEEDNIPITATRRASNVIPSNLDVEALQTDLSEVNPFRKPGLSARTKGILGPPSGQGGGAPTIQP
jgi:hypothetical protein